MSRKPITQKVKRLRQRRRTDGSWRIWWEPETDLRTKGFEPVELDADRPTWSVRRAEGLNRDVDRARGTVATAGPGGKSMAALIHQYRQSRNFLKLAEKTQRDYAAKLDIIETKWGAAHVAQFSKPVMHEWYQTLYDHHGKWQSAAIMRIMSLLFSFAELKGWRPENSNPCFRLKMEVPAGRKRVASWDEFDALVTAADTLDLPDFACALMLAALSGARQTDLRKARTDEFSDLRTGGNLGVLVWRYTRSKRGNEATIVVHPDAAPRVRNLLDGRTDTGVPLLTHAATGLPYSEDTFNDHWLAVRAQAARTLPAITSLQFRDLRRTFGAWSRAGGASKADVGDVLGNSAAVNAQLGEIYMAAQIDTISRAVTAIKRPVTGRKKTG